MDKLYTASVTATGGRNGKVVSDDGILNLDVKMPKALGGAGGKQQTLSNYLPLVMPLVLIVHCNLSFVQNE